MLFNVLRLKNFMSQKKLTVVFNGENKVIYGANEAGKTTILHAIKWLFFNKNALDAQFNPKPRGSTMLETEVELETDCGKFKRIQTEKWTKSRGKAQKELTGHTSKYYFDDVPKKEKYFKIEVENRIPEHIFKMLTDPLYFTKLNWVKQREILFELSGKIDMGTIKKMKDEITVLKEKRAKLNKELTAIPIRIDEANSGRPTPEFTLISLEKELKGINKRIKDLEKTKNSSHDDKISSLELSLEKLKLKIQKEKEADKTGVKTLEDLIKENNFELKNKVWQIITNLETRISNMNNTISQKRARLSIIDLQIKGKQGTLKTYEEQLIKLRNEYKDSQAKIDNESFSYCPECNQELPADQIQAVITKQKEKQDQERTVINSKGLAIKADKEALEKSITELQTEADELKNKDYLLSQELQSLNTELAGHKKTEKNLIHPNNAELQNKITEIKTKVYDNSEIEQLEIDIQTLTHDKEMLNKEYDTALEELEKEKEEVSKKKAVFSQIEDINTRIEHLKDEQKKNALLFEESEKELYESETKLREITTEIKETVDNLFELAKFNLFEVQMNGGIKDICEAQYKGIPFSDLNNAARINVGLDIINTQCKYYKTNVPVFIDNAESVNEVFKTDSQQILLKVVDPVKNPKSEFEKDIANRKLVIK